MDWFEVIICFLVAIVIFSPRDIKILLYDIKKGIEITNGRLWDILPK
jgi:Sec-independent protein translocase protein TatA